MKTMPAEEKVYTNTHHPLLRRLFRCPLMAVASHWLFQGLLYMDKTERWFKLGLDAVLTLAGYWIFRLWFAEGWALVLAFLSAHTLNFLLNGQLWGVLKGYGMVEIDPAVFDRYVAGIASRARREPAVGQLLVFGSLSRSQRSTSSDFDARIIRRPGLWKGLRACWFLLKERSRATFARFPLDVYVLDSDRLLARLRADEEAIDFLHER